MTKPIWGDEPPKRLLEEGSLWIMIATPSVWAAHFLLCYWIAAVWCAKVTEGTGSLAPVFPWLIGLTVAALALVGYLAWHARRHYHGHLMVEEELTEDSETERTRFLGNATLMLCCLSALAIVFNTLPVLVFDRCT